MKETAQQSSQVHNQFASMPGAAEYTKFMNDSMARFNQMFEEFTKLQTQAAQQATKAIDDSARLMKDSITYAQQLSDEFRKLSVENGKKAAEFFAPKS
jgi:hypothetical protein